MEQLSEKTRRLIFASIIISTMGTVLSTTLQNQSFGVVCVAVGGLFLIFAFAQKQKDKESEK